MRIAVITDEIDNDFERALGVMAEYGVKNAEIRAVWDKNIADAPDEYIDRIKAIADKRKVKIVGIASPFYKCDLGDSNTSSGPSGPLHAATARSFAEQMAVLNRCIEIAGRLGTRFVRVFTFWKNTGLTPEVEDRIAEAFAEPASIALNAGVKLLIENEHSCMTGTGKETARVLQKINSPAVRAVWDPGNAFMAGETPFPDGYEAIKPFIEHIHVKDACVVNKVPEWAVFGDGECQWAQQIAALADDGYTGFLSLETHYRGKTTKEAASRTCLERLIKMVKAVEPA
ncbi:MAG TPA: sugar phosphate isomerase/epimerase family protein [Capsulimonadaceae bacterium]|jgi:sugar phosphate isomerase/epimerase